MKNQTPMLHHVFFWLKNASSEEDKQKLIAGLQTLKQAGTPQSIRIGVPAATPRREVIDHSYDLSLLIAFNSVEEHDAYQEHPVHTKFVEEYSHLWGKVKVYDAADV